MIIVRCILDITTAGGTATSVLDIDVVGDATSTGDDIFDGADANATGISDSLNSTDNGTNGEGKSWKWDKKDGTNGLCNGQDPGRERGQPGRQAVHPVHPDGVVRTVGARRTHSTRTGQPGRYT